jgi:uncharacterized membrane protein
MQQQRFPQPLTHSQLHQPRYRTSGREQIGNRQQRNNLYLQQSLRLKLLREHLSAGRLAHAKHRFTSEVPSLKAKFGHGCQSGAMRS